MAIFSVNQVRHLYVVNAYKNSADALANAGDATFAKDGDSHIVLQYKNATGDFTASDLMKVDSITVTATSSKDIAYKVKGCSVGLDPEVNGGVPVAGQDYLLRVVLRNFVGMSDQDLQYVYGMVHAVSGMTAAKFINEMVVSLAKNTAKYACPIVDVYVYSTVNGMIQVTSKTSVADLEKYDDLDGKIYLKEAEQEWVLGTTPQAVIPFSVQTPEITVDGDRRLWGVVADYQFVDAEDKPIVLPEGQLIADLEYFCHGERGDIYRNLGWPKVIPTKYLVDPTKNYDVINIHYFYKGYGTSVQKAEKDLQIACLNDGSHTVANAVIQGLNTATGFSVPTLS